MLVIKGDSELGQCELLRSIKILISPAIVARILGQNKCQFAIIKNRVEQLSPFNKSSLTTPNE